MVSVAAPPMQYYSIFFEETEIEAARIILTGGPASPESPEIETKHFLVLKIERKCERRRERDILTTIYPAIIFN